MLTTHRFSNQILFCLSTTLTKLSVLALVHRVTAAGRSRTRHVVVALAAIIAVDGLIFIVVTIFQCQPISDYWTPSLTPQRCINEAAHLLAAGIINTVADFIVVVVPIRTVLSLSLPLPQRVAVAVLFAAGLLATAAGAVRTYFTWVIFASEDRDVSWHAADAFLTAVIELYVGIVSRRPEFPSSCQCVDQLLNSHEQLCASIPAARPFFVRYPFRWLALAGRSALRSDQPHESKDDCECAVEQTSPAMSGAITGVHHKKPHADDGKRTTEDALVGASVVKTKLSLFPSRSHYPPRVQPAYRQHSRQTSADSGVAPLLQAISPTTSVTSPISPPRPPLTYEDLNKPLPKPRTLDRFTFLQFPDRDSATASSTSSSLRNTIDGNREAMRSDVETNARSSTVEDGGRAVSNGFIPLALDIRRSGL